MTEPVQEPIVEPAQITDSGEPGGDFQQLHLLWKSHSNTILSVLAVAVIVAAGVSLFTYRTRNRNEEAARKALVLSSTQDLESFMGEYGSTRAAPFALLRLAMAYFSAGQYDLAFTKYSEFLRDNPKHDMATIAQLGLIHCREARGDVSTAQTEFAAFAAGGTNHFLHWQAAVGSARCLALLGRRDAARIAYEDIVANAGEDSGWLTVAEEALKQLANRERPKAPVAAAEPTTEEQATVDLLAAPEADAPQITLGPVETTTAPASTNGGQ